MINFSLGIENFKVFKEYQEFDIKPITILAGPNNSGKSSLINAIKLLSYIFKIDPLHEVDLNQPELNLGSFTSLKNFYTDKSSFAIKINDIKWNLISHEKLPDVVRIDSVEIYSNGKKILTLSELLGTLNEFPIYPVKMEFENLIPVVLDLMSAQDKTKKEKVKFFHKFYNENKAIFKNLNFIPTDGNLAKPQGIKLKNQIEIEYRFDHNLSKEGVYPHTLKNRAGAIEYIKKWIEQIGIKLPNNESNELSTIADSIVDLWAFSYSQLKKYLNVCDIVANYIYLDAFRGLPTRIIQSHGPNVFLDRGLLRFYRSILDDSYKQPKSYQTAEYQHFIEWIRKFNIGSNISIRYNDSIGYDLLVENNNDQRSLQDMGFGIMQLLPILVHSSNQPNPETLEDRLIIQEPESHLHPNYQSLLADFFVDSYIKGDKRNKTYLIETHSEYLIRKFQYLVAKNKLDQEDIVIYYINNQFDEGSPKNNLNVNKININSDGSLTDELGPGFLDEATNLKFDLLRLKNVKK